MNESSDNTQAEQVMRLMCDLYRTAERRDRRESRSYGLTPLQVFALIDVAEAPSGSLSMHEAAQSLAVSLSTMTRLADRLVEQGLVRRLPVPGDRRGVHIAPTPKGAELCQKVTASYLIMYQGLLEQVPVGERRKFIDQLGRLLVGLKSGLEESAKALARADQPAGAVETPKQ
jgi:DNA-binding MarR family transcriptional regulator